MCCHNNLILEALFAEKAAERSNVRTVRSVTPPEAPWQHGSHPQPPKHSPHTAPDAVSPARAQQHPRACYNRRSALGPNGATLVNSSTLSRPASSLKPGFVAKIHCPRPGWSNPSQQHRANTTRLNPDHPTAPSIRVHTDQTWSSAGDENEQKVQPARLSTP